MPSPGRRGLDLANGVADRRHRLRRSVTFAVLALFVVAATANGLAWYATSRLTRIDPVSDSYPLRVLAVGAGATTVTLSAGPDAAEPGTFRLAWQGGHAKAGSVVSSGPMYVTRELSQVVGKLSPGVMAGIEPDAFTGDPFSSLGIAFSTVAVSTQLGPMPAWWITGTRSTWVILVHGLDGSRTDTLAVIPALFALGFPILAITYRNDAGAPNSPDRQSHLGATEWHDVEAAVAYAVAHGASGVVLFGYSLGGAMAAVTAEDSPLGGRVSGLVLDSPILSWQATLDFQGASHSFPQPLITLTESMLAWRTGMNYGRFDQLQREATLRARVLLIQGSADTIVPPATAEAFFRARPDLVAYLPVGGADHVSAIDTDPVGYRGALSRFLSDYP